MMNPKEVLTMIGGLSAMKFFPGDVEARIAIAEQFAQFATSEEQVRYSIRRALALYSEWPGVHELRSIHCGHWKPADGIEAHSAIYLDGIPSEDESRNHELIGHSSPLRLAGGVESAPRDRDKMDFLHEALERRKAAKNVPLPTDEEIQRIKDEQARNRKESQ